VVSTNTGAVELWKKNGFQIIGTTPQGFRHAELGFVDTYIMYKKL
jgi:ribosomal protein S18 acetylase RimI-like enzyme